MVIDDDGVTVSDPDTGEVLVVFPSELLDAAETEYFDDGGGEGVLACPFKAGGKAEQIFLGKSVRGPDGRQRGPAFG